MDLKVLIRSVKVYANLNCADLIMVSMDAKEMIVRSVQRMRDALHLLRVRLSVPL